MAIDMQTEANRALAALNNGQFKTAFKTAKTVLGRHPDQPFFANLAGLALSRMGKDRDAIVYYQKAIRLNPGFIEAQRNLGQALVLLGMHDKAQTLIDRLLKQHPKDGDLLYLRALSLTQQSRFQEAEEAATVAIAASPLAAKSYNLRGIIRRHLNDTNGSLADYEQALQRTPNDPEALSNYSFALALKNRHDEALATLEKALQIAPDHVNVLLRYGGLLNELGRKPDCMAVYRHILALQPDHPKALANLATLQSRDENAGMAARLVSVFHKSPKGSPDQVDLGFALWSVFKQAGDLAEAEKWLVTANRLAAAMRPFDIAAKIAHQEKIFSHFPAGSPPVINRADTGPRPIFVLGLIRSGTTLTEQILSSHSHVYGAGELATAGALVEDFLASGDPLTEERAAEMAAAYRAELPDMPAGTLAFVDKMPGNFRLIGFLRAMFPDCRIINLVRDPRDTALSIFSNDFPAPGLNFTYDLGHIAQHFNQYRSAMAHWAGLYPGAVLDLEYKAMVSDVTATSKQLAEFCGLDWTPEMAAPEKNTRAVMTASMNQVRQGVNTRSLAGWKKHADMLAPFIQGLDPALWPELAEPDA